MKEKEKKRKGIHKMVVLPAESKPIINIRDSFGALLKNFANPDPIFPFLLYLLYLFISFLFSVTLSACFVGLDYMELYRLIELDMVIDIIIIISALQLILKCLRGILMYDFLF